MSSSLKVVNYNELGSFTLSDANLVEISETSQLVDIYGGFLDGGCNGNLACGNLANAGTCVNAGCGNVLRDTACYANGVCIH